MTLGNIANEELSRLAVRGDFACDRCYPIEALTQGLPTGRLLGGLAAQAVWIVLGSVLISLVWRRAIRKFTSVGN